MKRRWILIILTVLFLWFVVSRFTEIRQLRDTLLAGKWWWVLAAILTQAVFFVIFSATYQSAFSTVGIQTRTRDLIPVTLGSLFVNTVVPTGGAGGAALFAEDMKRRGKPATRTATAVLLQLICDFTAFTILLIPGLVYLFLVHDLKIYDILATAFLQFMTLFLSGVLILALWRPVWMHRLFGWSQRTANWIVGRFNSSLNLADDWAQKNAEEFSQAADSLARHPIRLLRTIGIAIVGHLVEATTLYTLFLAFNQPVSLGELAAGYGMGILFFIVSITPNGIGVVEGMMTLTFSQLGIPGAVAATVTLAFRGLQFWIPMLIGFFAVQRMRTAGPSQRALTEDWGVRFAAIMVGLMGVVNVLSAVTPSFADRLSFLEQFSPFEVQQGGRLTAALAGFALLLLAESLARRKAIAWYLTMTALGVSAASHLLKGLDFEEAALAIGLMVVLWLMRAHFHARSDPPSVYQGLRTLAFSVLFTLAYGVAGFFLLDRHFRVHFGLSAALRQTVVMFTQFYNPGLQPITGFGRYFAGSIYVVGAVTLGYALFMLVRPVVIRRPATHEDHERARSIVEAYGRSTLARFTLFEDKSYCFTQGGSVIAFTARGRAAIALGDPIGPPEDAANAIREFKDYCARNDWMPAFYQALPDCLDQYRRASLDAVSIGQEAILDVQNFSLEGRARKDLRSPYNRFLREGYQAVMHEPPLDDALLAELHSISDEWLTMMHGSEKRFSLGWFNEDYVRGSQVMAVHTPDGAISAFANILPEYQRNEAAVDLMRRRREIEPGTMDFLFVALFLWARSKGYATFNLGLSALSGVGEKSGDPAVEKALHYIYEHINQFYNFKGLYEYKNKFGPSWSPRYLIYPGPGALLPSVLALIEADSGNNLVQSYLKMRWK